MGDNSLCNNRIQSKRMKSPRQRDTFLVFHRKSSHRKLFRSLKKSLLFNHNSNCSCQACSTLLKSHRIINILRRIMEHNLSGEDLREVSICKRTHLLRHFQQQQRKRCQHLLSSLQETLNNRTSSIIIKTAIAMDSQGKSMTVRLNR